MAFLECSRAFVVVFIGLVLGTAGFCLTLAGWFAPPINDSVRGVRMAGPVLLVIGLLVLLFSCLLCAVSQHLCCNRCLQFCYDRQKDYYDDPMGQTVHVNVNHDSMQARETGHPLILDDMQDAFHACNKYANVSPLHRFAQQNRFNEAQREQYQQRMYDARCGYHESEVTDSTETPSTSPSHQPMLYDGKPVMASSPIHRTMYEGVGVRVKQSRSHDPPHLGVEEDVDPNKQYLDMSMHSTSSPYSNPPPLHTTDSTPPIKNTPSLSRKNSEKLVLPKPGLFLDRDPNDAGGASPRPERVSPEGPVWTPRTSRWAPTGPIPRDNIPPPPYKDPLMIHSDV